MEEPWGDEPSEEQRIGPEISWRVQPSETSRGHKPGDYIDEVWTPVEEWLDVVALSSVCEVVHLFTCRKDYDEADVEVSRHLFEYGTVSIDKRGGVTVQRVKEIKPGRPDNERRGVALPARPVAPAVARLGPLLSKAGVGRVALAMRDGSVLLPASDLGKGDVVCDEAYKLCAEEHLPRHYRMPMGNTRSSQCHNHGCRLQPAPPLTPGRADLASDIRRDEALVGGSGWNARLDPRGLRLHGVAADDGRRRRAHDHMRGRGACIVGRDRRHRRPCEGLGSHGHVEIWLG